MPFQLSDKLVGTTLQPRPQPGRWPGGVEAAEWLLCTQLWVFRRVDGRVEMGRGGSHTSLAEEPVTPSCTGHASGTSNTPWAGCLSYDPGEGEAREAEALVKGHQWGWQ